MTSLWHFILDEWCKCRVPGTVPWKSNKHKNYFWLASGRLLPKNRIRIRKSVVRIRGSGSVSKCHGSTTLVKGCFRSGFGLIWNELESGSRKAKTALKMNFHILKSCMFSLEASLELCNGEKGIISAFNYKPRRRVKGSEVVQCGSQFAFLILSSAVL